MLTLDCSVGEGGGGTIRTALPLSVITGQAVRLINVRAGRPADSRGIGWTHKAFIDAVCQWTNSHAEYSWGSTEVVFEPGNLPRGPVSIDLEDPDSTFATDSVRATRDYSGASDHFSGNIDNRDHRGIRGHAVSVFFLGLLPLLCMAEDEASIEVSGSTETLGAPFADAVRDILFPAASSLTGRDVGLSVIRRGCMGRGGGYARAVYRPRPSAVSRSHWDELCHAGMGGADESAINARFYFFGRDGWCEEAVQRSAAFIDRLTRLGPWTFETDSESIPYAVDRVQTLFLLGSPHLSRDVSFCADEVGIPDFDIPRTIERLAPEARHRDRPSRFLIEQMLPLLCLVEGKHEMATERITPHFTATASLVQELTGRAVLIGHDDSGSTVTVH